MCSTPKKRDEIYEFNDDYTQEPKEPNNPEYMKGWEDGYEAAKIEVTMYGEGQDAERNPNIGLWEEWDDQLKGGLADKKKPEEFDQAQLEKGIKVEYEHTNDRNKAKEIAMDHLTEDPNYYKKLRKMEGGVDESIKKSGSNYKVTNSSGNKTLGTHKTKKDALAQLRAIEISKKKRGK